MKKIILTSAAVLTAAAAFAQTSSTPLVEILKESDETKLQVELTSIQTIEVANKPVVLSYKTKEDYMSGVSTTETDHLRIFSTGGFTVKVGAKGDLIGNEGKTIEAEGISVRLGSAISSVPTDVFLKTDPQVLFTSDKGAANEKFSVIYKGAGHGAYLDSYKDGQDNIYETTVTYSIEAP